MYNEPIDPGAFDTSADLARAVTDSVNAQLPQEKRDAELAMITTGRELQARGSDWADGRGQLIGSIPARVYMRWAHILPGCWQSRQFVEEFLYDNPTCRGVGYRPKANSIRFGVSFYQQNKHKVA